MLKVFLLLFTLLTSSLTFAVAVYRSPTSAFPSGERARHELENSMRKVVSKTWYFIEANDQKGWLRASLVFGPWHLSKQAVAKSLLIIRSSPAWSGPVRGQINKGDSLIIKKIEEEWALVRSPEHREGWVEVAELAAATNDLGYAFPRANLFLQNAPQPHSSTRLKLNEGEQLEIESINGEWFKVRVKNQTGFVPVADVISKFDFAKYVRTNDGRRLEVDHVIGPWIKSGERYLSLSNINEIELREDLLFVAQRQANLRSEPNFEKEPSVQLSFLQPARLISKKEVKWALSQFSKSASLWWLFDKETSASFNEPEEIATKDLFARKIYAIATSPTKPNLMFASAGGVYLTRDGQQWTRLKEFKDQNYPIAIAPSGTVFIGSYRSFDNKHFEQYIRWEKIASILERRYKSAPQSLTILNIKIEDHEGSNIVLTMNTGWGKTNVWSADGGHTWKIFDRL